MNNDLARIRVLGKLWNVIPTPGLYRDEETYGLCIASQLKIKVDADLVHQQARDTLWHELFHAAEKELGLNIPERVVRQISTVQLQVMRENPGLMKFLLEEDADPSAN